jgi:hypothetical protein
LRALDHLVADAGTAERAVAIAVMEISLVVVTDLATR